MIQKARLFWTNSVVAAWNHPWAKDDRIGTFSRILTWQLRSRFARDAILVDWIGGTLLSAKTSMHGATGNLYYGLAEFADMAFFLHFLRADDCFGDIGANIGSYSIMAAKLRSTKVVSFEPAPETLPALATNIKINGLMDRVEIRPMALAESAGEGLLTEGLDSMNRLSNDKGASKVPVSTADQELAGSGLTALKVDVEGAEEGVLKGATKLLQERQLVAIEIESLPGESRSLIESANFVEWFYDPILRRLHSRDCGLSPNNHLFLRVGSENEIADRLAQAPTTHFGKLQI